MKPSQTIKQLRKKLVKSDWLKWGQNQHSEETWEKLCNGELSYDVNAINEYLDYEYEARNKRNK